MASRRQELGEKLTAQAGQEYSPEDIEFTETEDGVKAQIKADAIRRELRGKVLAEVETDAADSLRQRLRLAVRVLSGRAACSELSYRQRLGQAMQALTGGEA